MVLGGTGSDTGGSIRGPAALCGLAGIKPTYGLCSRAGVLPLSYTLDHTGPLAWTSEDCALLLQAMAGHDPNDPASANRPTPDFTALLGKDVKGLRIGVARTFFDSDNRVNDTTRAGINAALDQFTAMGAEVRDVDLSPMADYHACGFLILVAEAYALHEPWLKSRFNDYGESFRDRIALGAFIRSADYIAAIRKRRALCLELKAAMADLDILVSAAAVSEPPKITEVPKWATLDKPSFTMPFNVTGYPAMSICTGFGVGGLPLSMQLIAKPFAEPVLFQAAHAYETATDWRSKRPALVS
jgi:aspartyl-tRNA(Asn)/glutamyl-tRNA(Gln) amidotransferase subunit A